MLNSELSQHVGHDRYRSTNNPNNGSFSGGGTVHVSTHPTADHIHSTYFYNQAEWIHMNNSGDEVTKGFTLLNLEYDAVPQFETAAQFRDTIHDTKTDVQPL